jgi:hypothetical protein
MNPLFHGHREYPKAIRNLACASDRLDRAEEDIARAALDVMRQDAAEESKRVQQKKPAKREGDSNGSKR